MEAALRGTADIALAVVLSTLTTVVAFIPIMFMSGEGDMRVLAVRASGCRSATPCSEASSSRSCSSRSGPSSATSWQSRVSEPGWIARLRRSGADQLADLAATRGRSTSRSATVRRASSSIVIPIAVLTASASHKLPKTDVMSDRGGQRLRRRRSRLELHAQGRSRGLPRARRTRSSAWAPRSTSSTSGASSTAAADDIWINLNHQDVLKTRGGRRSGSRRASRGRRASRCSARSTTTRATSEKLTFSVYGDDVVAARRRRGRGRGGDRGGAGRAPRQERPPGRRGRGAHPSRPREAAAVRDPARGALGNGPVRRARVPAERARSRASARSRSSSSSRAATSRRSASCARRRSSRRPAPRSRCPRSRTSPSSAASARSTGRAAARARASRWTRPRRTSSALVKTIRKRLDAHVLPEGFSYEDNKGAELDTAMRQMMLALAPLGDVRVPPDGDHVRVVHPPGRGRSSPSRSRGPGAIMALGFLGVDASTSSGSISLVLLIGVVVKNGIVLIDCAARLRRDGPRPRHEALAPGRPHPPPPDPDDRAHDGPRARSDGAREGDRLAGLVPVARDRGDRRPDARDHPHPLPDPDHLRACSTTSARASRRISESCSRREQSAPPRRPLPPNPETRRPGAGFARARRGR